MKKPAARPIKSRHLGSGESLNEQRMLRNGKDVRALGLPVPARDACKAVSDVFDLDVERRRIEEIELAPRQHPLPCS